MLDASTSAPQLFNAMYSNAGTLVTNGVPLLYIVLGFGLAIVAVAIILKAIYKAGRKIFG